MKKNKVDTKVKQNLFMQAKLTKKIASDFEKQSKLLFVFGGLCAFFVFADGQAKSLWPYVIFLFVLLFIILRLFRIHSIRFKSIIQQILSYFFADLIAPKKSNPSWLNFIIQHMTPVWLNNFVSRPVDMSLIDQMTGREFEQLCAKLYSKLGYSVNLTKETRDQGADLVLSDQVGRIVVQAKRQVAPVGNWAIQEVCRALGMYKAYRAVVITNSTFTASARELALANRVDLVDRADFAHLLRLAGLLTSEPTP